MKKAEIAVPIVALVAITRALGGAGIALLFGDKLGQNKLRIGRILFGIGFLSTAPLLYEIFGSLIRQRLAPMSEEPRVLHS